jgi:hypothetical protein
MTHGLTHALGLRRVRHGMRQAVCAGQRGWLTHLTQLTHLQPSVVAQVRVRPRKRCRVEGRAAVGGSIGDPGPAQPLPVCCPLLDRGLIPKSRSSSRAVAALSTWWTVAMPEFGAAGRLAATSSMNTHRLGERGPSFSAGCRLERAWPGRRDATTATPPDLQRHRYA